MLCHCLEQGCTWVPILSFPSPADAAAPHSKKAVLRKASGIGMGLLKPAPIVFWKVSLDPRRQIKVWKGDRIAVVLLSPRQSPFQATFHPLLNPIAIQFLVELALKTQFLD